MISTCLTTGHGHQIIYCKYNFAAFIGHGKADKSKVMLPG